MKPILALVAFLALCLTLAAVFQPPKSVEPAPSAPLKQLRTTPSGPLKDLSHRETHSTALTRFQENLKRNPINALTWLNGSSLRQSHFAPSVRTYLETLDPAQAYELAKLLKDDHELQFSVISDVIVTWAETDPQDALDRLKQNSTSPTTELLAKHLGEMSTLGPPDQVLEKLEPGPVENLIANATLLQWLYQESDAAITFLNSTSLPASFVDAALNDYADGILQSDPVSAMSFAQSIQSESLRSMLTSQIKQTWTREQAEEFANLQSEGAP